MAPGMLPDIAGEAAFHRVIRTLSLRAAARGNAGAHRASRRSRHRRWRCRSCTAPRATAGDRIDGTCEEARSSAGGYSRMTVLALSIRPNSSWPSGSRLPNGFQRIAEQHQPVAPRRVVVVDLLELRRDVADPARPAMQFLGFQRRRLRIDRQHRQRRMGQIGGDRPEMPADLDDMRAVAHEMRGQHLAHRSARSRQMRDVVGKACTSRPRWTWSIPFIHLALVAPLGPKLTTPQ